MSKIINALRTSRFGYWTTTSEVVRRLLQWSWIAPVVGVVGLVLMLDGLAFESMWFLCLGLAAVAASVLLAALQRWSTKSAATAEAEEDLELAEFEPDEPLSNTAPDDVESLVEQMLARGRQALLLRSQIAANLSKQLYQRAYDALQNEMGLVPAGDVQLEPSVFDIDYLELAGDDSEHAPLVLISVESLFLDRHPVTNKQFQRFVSVCGYQEMALWDHEVWPAVLDFVDSTGHPGPRFWKDGRYPPGEANQPVVGVSWYEAAAYARWVGKRLPTDAEWAKAGCWPIALSQHSRVQRRYPWGDTMDRRKANIWNSGPGRIVPVDEFADGVSVGGLYQLIGNVWEWTASNLDIDPSAEAEGRMDRPLLKSIRGGAFDTYFENQANCQFASGENPIGRKHNVGFRCALSVADVAAAPADSFCATITDGLQPEVCEEVLT